MFMYHDDLMRVPAHHTPHQLVGCTDHMIHHYPMYLVCTSCAEKGPNRVSAVPKEVGGKSPWESDLLNVWSALVWSGGPFGRVHCILISAPLITEGLGNQIHGTFRRKDMELAIKPILANQSRQIYPL